MKDGSMKEETYILPVRLKIRSIHPDSAVRFFNERLEEAIAKIATELVAEEDGVMVEGEWTINKNISVRRRNERNTSHK